MYDFAIIGAGIVGLSTAWQLQQRHPDKRIVVLEKESAVARHQTGHNSGVIHAGIYYEPGSLKARFCRAGVDRIIAFCREHGIRYEQCGKLIVATNELEQERLQVLFDRALENGLDVELLDSGQLKQKEPNVTGTGAIFLRTTGIVSYREVSESMAEQFQAAGGELHLGFAVSGLEESAEQIRISTPSGDAISARYLIACGGLMADRLARMQGLDINFRIVPYRGEYYQLPTSMNDIVKHLIYPVPDPALPFLGVHLTRMIDGSVTVGPNAAQGWKREGYGHINFSLRDAWELVTYAGFWRASFRFLRTGLAEIRDAIWKPGYLKRVRKYCPSISIEDLRPYPAGVRATAVDRDGNLIDDFLIAESSRSLHVCSAPSPAATSAIPIGKYICDRLEKKLAHG